MLRWVYKHTDAENSKLEWGKNRIQIVYLSSPNTKSIQRSFLQIVIWKLGHKDLHNILLCEISSAKSSKTYLYILPSIILPNLIPSWYATLVWGSGVNEANTLIYKTEPKFVFATSNKHHSSFVSTQKGLPCYSPQNYVAFGVDLGLYLMCRCVCVCVKDSPNGV